MAQVLPVQNSTYSAPRANQQCTAKVEDVTKLLNSLQKDLQAKELPADRELPGTCRVIFHNSDLSDIILTLGFAYRESSDPSPTSTIWHEPR